MDNDKILEKVKMKIAISNLNKEDIVVNNSKKKKIGIVACILLSTSAVVFATNMIINKFDPNSSKRKPNSSRTWLCETNKRK